MLATEDPAAPTYAATATLPSEVTDVSGPLGRGGWGSIMKLTQLSPTADTGTLSLFFAGNESVTGLDDTTFLSRDVVTFVEDAGDTLGSNEGDNEITGVHVSDGDPGAQGILGAKARNLSNGEWRFFWTQQHGDNVTWEVTAAK